MHYEKHNFEEYGKLIDFRNNLFNRRLSLEEAINEQNTLLGLINQSEKNVTKNKIGRPFTKNKKKKTIKEVIEKLKQAYETRYFIIDEFENTEGKQKK